jgi:hypothetical protein
MKDLFVARLSRVAEFREVRSKIRFQNDGSSELSRWRYVEMSTAKLPTVKMPTSDLLGLTKPGAYHTKSYKYWFTYTYL